MGLSSPTTFLNKLFLVDFLRLYERKEPFTIVYSKKKNIFFFIIILEIPIMIIFERLVIFGNVLIHLG